MASPCGFTRRSLLRFLAPAVLGLSGCSTVPQRGVTLLPTAHEVKSGPFVVFSNDPIKSDAPEVRALDQLRTDLCDRLKIRDHDDSGPIEVYVLADRGAFLHLLKFYFPELPARRAFFLAQDEQRIVYTYHGPMLEEDLRHEATHALLRGRYGDVPLWLDEGLAEYFEVGPSDRRDREVRLEKLAADLKGGWKPDLRRLESLEEVRQMAPRDYRESWAWVDMLLSDPDRGGAALMAHLQSSVGGPSLAERLSDRGVGSSTLLAYLNGEPPRIVAQKPAGMGADSRHDRVVRLQDRGVEPLRPISEPRRPGFFRRFGSWLGF